MTPGDRERAPRFYRALTTAETPADAMSELSRSGFVVDYVEDQSDRRLGAVRLGEVRLIDNVPLGDPR